MHSSPRILVIFALACLAIPTVALGQRYSPPPFGSNLDVTRSRIGDERVQRQTEIMRLEQMMEQFETRMGRLERHQLRSAQLPAITIAEAEAAVDFAKARLKEAEYQLERGEANEVQFAAAKLGLTQAEGQLDSAKAAHEERLLLTEMDIVFAQRKLLQISQARELNERFTAKGYTTSDSLRYLILDEELAKKELQIAKLRLDALRKSAGKEDGEEEATEKPESSVSRTADPPMPEPPAEGAASVSGNP